MYAREITSSNRVSAKVDRAPDGQWRVSCLTPQEVLDKINEQEKLRARAADEERRLAEEAEHVSKLARNEALSRMKADEERLRQAAEIERVRLNEKYKDWSTEHLEVLWRLAGDSPALKDQEREFLRALLRKRLGISDFFGFCLAEDLDWMRSLEVE